MNLNGVGIPWGMTSLYKLPLFGHGEAVVGTGKAQTLRRSIIHNRGSDAIS